MTKRLACELSACTGLRIGDVLNLPRFLFQNRKPAARASSFQDEAARWKKQHSDGCSGLSPHSARKIYAVTEYRRTGSLQRVKELLNHSDEAVTMLYAMADELTERRRKKT